MREYSDQVRKLVALICDKCGARICVPFPKDSGWTYSGYYNGPGTEIFGWYYCGRCS
jgi:hypothetical protein